MQGNKEILPGMPIPKSPKDISNFINKLPEVDSPQVYGLPLNIDQALQRANTTQSINSLKLIMSMSVESVKFQKDRWNKLLMPLVQNWKQIYKHIKDSNFPQIKPNMLLTDDPVEGFIFLEAQQALTMLETVNDEFLEI
jgi:dynein heavy chain 2